MSERIAYKVMTRDELEAMRREGAFRGSPADLADGFIHLSSGAQLAATVDKHYPGQAGLVIATVDLTRLGEAVRWEPSRGGELFPHLYGTLPMAAVLGAGPLERSADGSVKLPGVD